jgi:hypothetical protein
MFQTASELIFVHRTELFARSSVVLVIARNSIDPQRAAETPKVIIRGADRFEAFGVVIVFELSDRSGIRRAEIKRA